MTDQKVQFNNPVFSQVNNNNMDGMTKEQVEDRVNGWNWNLNIFEIYDELQDDSAHDRAKLLAHAYHYFKQDSLIKELASHFGIYDLD